MRVSRLVFLFLSVSLFFASCSKELPSDPDPKPGTHADAAANKWIFEQMKEKYLYNYKAKAITNPDYNQTSEAFFKSLLSDSPADNDGKMGSDGVHNFYSEMERTRSTSASISTSTKASVSLSYGFEFVIIPLTYNTQTIYAARVLYVLKGSPAAKAGLVRGDFILAIGSEDITNKNYEKLQSGDAVSLDVFKSVYSDGFVSLVAPRTVDMSAASIIESNPVLLDTVYTINSNKIGYIVYNSFDDSFDASMKEAFGRMKSQGASDIIVDLRYNPGGFISSCQLLASMIVPQEYLVTENVFATGKFNADRTAKGESLVFKFNNRNEVANTNLNLAPAATLYVLTGRWTASASEALINGLAPYMNVRCIGWKTEGKNVGSQEISSGTYKITLHPITITIYNSDNKSDYKNGFTPAGNDLLDELGWVSDVQVNMRALGDTDEYLLRYAIAAITGVPVVEAASANAPVVRGHSSGFTKGEVIYSSVNERRLKGIIINEDIPK